MARPRTARNRSPVSKQESYKFKFSDVDWTHKISDCPAYYPTLQEFDDPFIYLQKIAPEASQFGICKIISPVKASVSAADVLKKEIKGFEFGTYIQPLRLPKWNANDTGVFFSGERKHTYDTFESEAIKMLKRQSPRLGDLPPSYVEKKFWLEMTHGRKGTVEYGVNIEGSAFSSDPNDQLGKCKWHLKGITDPMLYIGMLFSMFAWHVEDHYLYSINYHHSGAPKTWYGVPGHHALQFEKVARNHVYSRDILSAAGEDGAFEVIAEKTTIFPPKILLDNGVSVYKAVQKPGEFVITFPRVYHAGFSNGFNCGEAVNFAIRDWFPFGEEAGKRYARLHKMVILPYQELLFKEVSEQEATDIPSSVKATVLHHIRSLNNTLFCLNNLKMPFDYLQNSQGSFVCDLCKRDCYLAFTECKSCQRYTCLFHGMSNAYIFTFPEILVSSEAC
ncbi:Lysine-specific demethylase [Citrus sinensis]|uniref:Lysine-specific demethylase n=1 Tax=Citrus sinensis TaxID=2711 RepID=A0ACB8MF48_CITSI|nr:Lysine-specific demethylase [Citrus sinensis]